MMLPTIIFLSYFLAMNGYFLGRNWNFILSALAGLLAIIFLLHPFYIFLSLLMMEGLNLCSGDADVRLKGICFSISTRALPDKARGGDLTPAQSKRDVKEELA